MLTRKEILSNTDLLFPFCWGLYLESFPEEERRGLEYHLATMTKRQFHCDAILDGETPVGILFWWDLKEFTFVEHLATTPEVRGRGYGAEVLRGLIAGSDKPILLEVEHPTDIIARRRIEFYRRMGFVLNDHPYCHPSYQKIEGEFVHLMIMTHPEPISAEALQGFMEGEFPTIHF